VIETVLVDCVYVPLNERAPCAAAYADVPPSTFAVPENETSLALPAHACALRTTRWKEPDRPLSVAVPLNTAQLELVNSPTADPLSELDPINLPRPVRVALPDALVPLTFPAPTPRYEPVNECAFAARPAGASRQPTIAASATALPNRATCRDDVTGRI
jgi:hypothetical protein